jgi:hypothetical protein
MLQQNLNKILEDENRFQNSQNTKFGLENINGQEFYCLTNDNNRIMMEKRSVLEHLEKHKDLGINQPYDYLLLAEKMIKKGRKYKNGILYNGLFLVYYDSEEFKCPIVNTIYRRFI